MRRLKVSLISMFAVLGLPCYSFCWHAVTHTVLTKEATFSEDPVLIMASIGPDGFILTDYDDLVHAPVPKKEWLPPKGPGSPGKPNFAYYILKKTEGKRGAELTREKQRLFALGWGAHIAADWVVHGRLLGLPKTREILPHASWELYAAFATMWLYYEKHKVLPFGYPPKEYLKVWWDPYLLREAIIDYKYALLLKEHSPGNDKEKRKRLRAQAVRFAPSKEKIVNCLKGITGMGGLLISKPEFFFEVFPSWTTWCGVYVRNAKSILGKDERELKKLSNWFKKPFWREEEYFHHPDGKRWSNLDAYRKAHKESKQIISEWFYNPSRSWHKWMEEYRPLEFLVRFVREPEDPLRTWEGAEGEIWRDVFLEGAREGIVSVSAGLAEEKERPIGEVVLSIKDPDRFCQIFDEFVEREVATRAPSIRKSVALLYYKFYIQNAFDLDYLTNDQVLDTTAPDLEIEVSEENPPTITAKVSDKGGAGIDWDFLKMWLDGKEVSPTVDKEKGLISYIPSELLDEGEHGVDVEILDKAANRTKKGVKFRVLPPPEAEIPQGLSFISFPSPPKEEDPAKVFGIPPEEFKWARFNPEANPPQYVLYSQDQSRFTWLGESCLGKGYWVLLPGPCKVRLKGNPKRREAFPIPLKPGWNMIGLPFLDAVTWSLLELKVKHQGEEKTLEEAQEAGWIEDYAWGYDWGSGSYRLVYDERVIPGVLSALEPWRGYWLKAKVRCELVLPPPKEGRRTRAGGEPVEGWTLRLVAKAGAGKESDEVLIGEARRLEGRNRLRIDSPPPPPAGRGLDIFVLDEQGDRLAVDIRQGRKERMSWEIGVEVPEGAGEVTLIWPGLGKVKNDVAFFITDLRTGRKVYMRTNISLRFEVRGEEGVRMFRVEAERGGVGLLRVVGLSARAVRAKKRRMLFVVFSLTRGARTKVTLRGMTGRIVMEVESGGSRNAGANRVVVPLDGVGPGVYLVEVEAVDEEGRRARAKVPAVVR